MKYDENVSRIEILEENIKGLLEYDDESQMFSPRLLSGSNEQKIAELKKEKEALEGENIYIKGRIKYYEDKVDALESAISDTEESVNTDGTDNPDELVKNDPVREEPDSTEKLFGPDDYVITKKELKKMINKLTYSVQLLNINSVRCKSEINSVIDYLNEIFKR
ncbi:MAG: hypothetical protein K6G83_02930 [Lachnospiraceae bacterium]|nr:hypothetical protein [Lachnospiraceae bacterium]